MATSEPVIFNTVVEGARKAYGKRLTPELLAKLRAVGMDFLAQARAAGWMISTTRLSRVWNGRPVTVTLNTLTTARTGGGAGA